MRYHRAWPRPTTGNKLLVACTGPAAVTLLALLDRHPETAVVAVLYVLAVVIAARVGGAVAGIAASIMSFLALNFFFTQPLHTFAVAAPEDLVSLFSFLVASVIVGLLLSAALDSKAKAERREFEARLLNQMATRLLAGERTEKVLDHLAAGIRNVFQLDDCEIYTSITNSSRQVPLDSGSSAEVFPLETGTLDLGHLRLRPGLGRRLNEEETRAIRSLATQLALALEGIRLSAQVRRAELEAQASQLKAALFSGVTHDVKTPLAAIMATITNLTEGGGFSEATRREHLETIKQEAERLHRVVNNLLDVPRLRAGALVANKTLSPIDETHGERPEPISPATERTSDRHSRGRRCSAGPNGCGSARSGLDEPDREYVEVHAGRISDLSPRGRKQGLSASNSLGLRSRHSRGGSDTLDGTLRTR